MRSCHTAVASSYETLVNTLIKSNPHAPSRPSTEIPAHLCSLHSPNSQAKEAARVSIKKHLFMYTTEVYSTVFKEIKKRYCT